MSLFGTVSNYGGKQPDNSQGIKQFVEGPSSQAVWVYKRLPSGVRVQTPANSSTPVFIASDLYVNGSIYNPSDATLKKNIHEIWGEQANMLLDIKPVSFTFNNDVKSNVHYGFIAQDFEKVYPNLVKNSEMGYKTINYIELIPVLVSKIQSLDAEIEALKNEIYILKNKNEK